LLFDAGNVLAFSQGMLRLQSEPLLCKSLGAQAKQRAEIYFSADVLYGALKSFYATEFDRMKR
jgi:ribosomal protein L35AE/L33A